MVIAVKTTMLLKKIKSYFTLSNGVLLVALSIAFSCVWLSVIALQKNFVLQQKVDTLAQENAVYELANDSQRLQNKYYQSQEYLELSAREHLGLVSPGEKLLVLPANTVKSPPETEAAPPVVPLAKRSNFDQWMYFLFGQKS